jgi:uncharacterized damage-inducible protein DinB
MREFLIDTVAHLPPARTLEGLATTDAERRLDGANHSIAEILAHLIFWQTWFSNRCNGIPQPIPAPASHGWPAVSTGSWPDLRETFLDGLERLAAFGDDEGRLNARIEPAIDFPPLAGYTIREALVHVAQHNAHHLGQVILLRQFMGAWPPPSGSWTW